MKTSTGTRYAGIQYEISAADAADIPGWTDVQWCDAVRALLVPLGVEVVELDRCDGEGGWYDSTADDDDERSLWFATLRGELDAMIYAMIGDGPGGGS